MLSPAVASPAVATFPIGSERDRLFAAIPLIVNTFGGHISGSTALASYVKRAVPEGGDLYPVQFIVPADVDICIPVQAEEYAAAVQEMYTQLKGFLNAHFSSDKQVQDAADESRMHHRAGTAIKCTQPIYVTATGMYTIRVSTNATQHLLDITVYPAHKYASLVAHFPCHLVPFVYSEDTYRRKAENVDVARRMEHNFKIHRRQCCRHGVCQACCRVQDISTYVRGAIAPIACLNECISRMNAVVHGVGLLPDWLPIPVANNEMRVLKDSLRINVFRYLMQLGLTQMQPLCVIFPTHEVATLCLHDVRSVLLEERPARPFQCAYVDCTRGAGTASAMFTGTGECVVVPAGAPRGLVCDGVAAAAAAAVLATKYGSELLDASCVSDVSTASTSLCTEHDDVTSEHGPGVVGAEYVTSMQCNGTDVCGGDGCGDAVGAVGMGGRREEKWRQLFYRYGSVFRAWRGAAGKSCHAVDVEVWRHVRIQFRRWAQYIVELKRRRAELRRWRRAETVVRNEFCSVTQAMDAQFESMRVRLDKLGDRCATVKGIVEGIRNAVTLRHQRHDAALACWQRTERQLKQDMQRNQGLLAATRQHVKMCIAQTDGILQSADTCKTLACTGAAKGEAAASTAKLVNQCCQVLVYQKPSVYERPILCVYEAYVHRYAGMVARNGIAPPFATWKSAFQSMVPICATRETVCPDTAQGFQRHRVQLEFDRHVTDVISVVKSVDTIPGRCLLTSAPPVDQIVQCIYWFFKSSLAPLVSEMTGDDVRKGDARFAAHLAACATMADTHAEPVAAPSASCLPPGGDSTWGKKVAPMAAACSGTVEAAAAAGSVGDAKERTVTGSASAAPPALFPAFGTLPVPTNGVDVVEDILNSMFSIPECAQQRNFVTMFVIMPFVHVIYALCTRAIYLDDDNQLFLRRFREVRLQVAKIQEDVAAMQRTFASIGEAQVQAVIVKLQEVSSSLQKVRDGKPESELSINPAAAGQHAGAGGNLASANTNSGSTKAKVRKGRR
jgi:hypothetical protein